MRITNIQQYTENHRFYVFREFAMSGLDYKMLSLIYQPMVGALAVSLYQLLYHSIPDDRYGYSPVDQQRRLFLGLGLEPNEAGRRRLIEQTSLLEAVGLLQSSRIAIPDKPDFLYEYELLQPLSSNEFFRNLHLMMLLRDKVGRYAVLSLRQAFGSAEPEELAYLQYERDNLSVPFYELFQLNVKSSDPELEQAIMESAPARQAVERPPLETAGISFGDLIMRFPRNSRNRRSVEKLRHDAEQMAQVNYVAYKYQLGVVDMCRLLDEDDLFDGEDRLLFDELQRRANLMYRQGQKRDNERERTLGRGGQADASVVDEEYAVDEEFFMPVPPQLVGRCDTQQYNMLMRNEPHLRFIKRFFPGAVPDWMERVFEKLDLNYRLPEPVINVLIHYVLGMNDSRRVTAAFIDAVASNMLVKQVDTFEKAVSYVRTQLQEEQERQRRKETGAGAGERGGRSSQRANTGRKPSIQIVSEEVEQTVLSDEEMAELQELARRMDEQS